MCASFIKEDARYNIDIIILAQPDFQHVECAECGRDVCGRETVQTVTVITVNWSEILMTSITRHYLGQTTNL